MTLEPLPDDLAADQAREAQAYRRALGAFATGVCVVTTDDAEGTVGVTINSFASVSLRPRLVVWSLDERSERHEVFARAERFAIHVLGADGEAISQRFARGAACRIGPDELARDDGGLPCIPGAVARFDCVAHHRLPMGDHLMIVGRVEGFEVSDGAALTFHRGRYGRAGEGA